MFSALLIVAAWMSELPAADPAELVARLGAPRYADREAAATGLEELGRKALPALRDARTSRDIEVRTRAAALVSRIEGSLLTRPTMVRLDFDDVPVVEVLRGLSDESGVRLSLVPPEDSPNWKSRRVTLREPAPVPFWQAMDRLCEAARLQYNAGMHGPGSAREPSFPLFEGGMRPTNPVFDSGPFRVTLLGLNFQRSVSFPPSPAPRGRRRAGADDLARVEPAVSEEFFAQLQVAAEPRLSLSQSGPLRVTEATDEKGQSLLAETAAGEAPVRRASGYFGVASGSVLQPNVALSRPGQAGRVIKTLRGVLPVTVSSRKPVPLAVKLSDAAGRSFQNEDVLLTLNQVRSQSQGRQFHIDLSIRPNQAPGQVLEPADGVPVRPEGFQQQLEVVDAQGRIVSWFPSVYDSETGRMTLTLTPVEPGSTPAELRYYGLIRASTEVRFEFGDLPLP
jgi:hypothetical protein